MKNLKYLLLFVVILTFIYCKKADNNDILPPDVTTGTYSPAHQEITGGINNFSEYVAKYGHVWDTFPDPKLETALDSSVYEYTGALTDSITIITPVNFLPNTKYYMRGYAIDKFGKVILGQQVLEYDPSDSTHNPVACFTASQSACNALTCSVNFDASCSTPENLIISYKWDVDGDGFFDFSGADKQKISYVYDAADTYTVKLELITSDGIANDSTHIIQVYDIVNVFDLSSSITYEDCEVTFINNSTGATSYLWDFGDGNTSTEENPTHIYENPGNYTVTLKAMLGGVETESMKNITIASSIKFENIRDGGIDDVYEDVIALSDGSYVIAGYTTSQGTDFSDVYLIKTDANGNMLWEKTFGGSLNDRANSIISAPNGGYVIAGYINSQGTESADAYLIKTDANGNMQWDKIFGGSSIDWANSIVSTADGGYVIAGSTIEASSNDVYLIKTDVNGNLQWDKTFGGSGNDIAYSIVSTLDGGYVIAGYTSEQLLDSEDVYLIKTDANGNMLWEKTFGDSSNLDIAYSIVSTADGGYIIAGVTNNPVTVSSDVYLIKIDANGNIQWEKTFGDSSADIASSIVSAPDGGYVIAGFTNSQGASSSDVYLIKTDANGNMLWDKTFGGSGDDRAYSIKTTNDCGYIIAGKYDNGSNEDFYLIKTDSEGNAQ